MREACTGHFPKTWLSKSLVFMMRRLKKNPFIFGKGFPSGEGFRER
jgi:hypothetical protein